MKRAMLAATMVAGLAGPVCAAELPVVDAINNSLHLKELGEWAKQLADMKQQYDKLTQTYYALAHITDIGSAVSALGALGIQNPLGSVNPMAAEALISGRGGPQGMLGSLSSLYNGSQSADRVYQPTGNDWNSKEINANDNGIAGSKALAMQLYQSASQRAQLLPQLQALLGVATDPSERETLANRISLEQANIANQQVQAQALATTMQAQFQNREQRREEHMQQGWDAVLQDAAAHGVAGAWP